MARDSDVTLTRAQAPTLPGACCWLQDSTSHAPGAAGVGLDTPVRLYLFVLLLCSFLNQVLPSSVPVCSYLQGICLQDTPGGQCSREG